MANFNGPTQPYTQPSSHPAQSLISSLGLPSILAQALVPSLLKLLSRYPRTAKVLTYLFAFFSTVGAITFGFKPLLEKIIWNWLPTIELQSNDDLYGKLQKFVRPKSTPTNINLLKAASSEYRSRSNCFTQDSEELVNDGLEKSGSDVCLSQAKIVYKASGSRVFVHKGTLFVMETPFGTNGRTPESVCVRAFALSQKPLKSLLKEISSSKTRDASSKTTTIYRPQYGRWQKLKQKMSRPVNTINISDKQKDKIIDDITNYLSPVTQQWYEERGIPHRRGYLFHGPPGTGKSSFAGAIAGHFDLDLYTIDLTRTNDDGLAELMNSLPTRSVVLLEDIDSAGINREDEGRYSSTVTLSGLLNALDGAIAPEGHILIMSTNTPDELDPALVRAGRVDSTVHFPNATKFTAAEVFKRMFSAHFENLNEAEVQAKADLFIDHIPDGVLSPAEIQGYLLDHVHDVEGVTTGADAWVKEMIDKHEKAEKAVQAKLRAKKEKAEHEKRELELAERRQAMEEERLKKEDAARAELLKIELETKAVVLKADRLRADAEIAHLESRKMSNLTTEQDGPMTPADSDDEPLMSKKYRNKVNGDQEYSKLDYGTNADDTSH